MTVAPETVEKALELVFGVRSGYANLDAFELMDERLLTAAYRKKAMHFHPDRAEVLGLDERALDECHRKDLAIEESVEPGYVELIRVEPVMSIWTTTWTKMPLDSTAKPLSTAATSSGEIRRINEPQPLSMGSGQFLPAAVCRREQHLTSRPWAGPPKYAMQKIMPSRFFTRMTGFFRMSRNRPHSPCNLNASAEKRRYLLTAPFHISPPSDVNRDTCRLALLELLSFGPTDNLSPVQSLL